MCKPDWNEHSWCNGRIQRRQIQSIGSGDRYQCRLTKSGIVNDSPHFRDNSDMPPFFYFRSPTAVIAREKVETVHEFGPGIEFPNKNLFVSDKGLCLLLHLESLAQVS
jgi:hypothetical protein